MTAVDEEGLGPTSSSRRAGLRQLEVVCPADEAGGLRGCGARFRAAPDAEGFWDCPQCGLWFRPPALAVDGPAEPTKNYKRVTFDRDPER